MTFRSTRGYDLNTNHNLFFCFSLCDEEMCYRYELYMPNQNDSSYINEENGPISNGMHFSFPFYWVFEGKIDGISD